MRAVPEKGTGLTSSGTVGAAVSDLERAAPETATAFSRTAAACGAVKTDGSSPPAAAVGRATALSVAKRCAAERRKTTSTADETTTTTSATRAAATTTEGAGRAPYETRATLSDAATAIGGGQSSAYLGLPTPST